MYYFNVNIILVILLYQCLTTYTFENAAVNEEPSDESDCSLWPSKYIAPEMPEVLTSNPYDGMAKIFPDNAGHVDVKRNRHIALKCGSAKFAAADFRNDEEIIVKCVGGEYVDYKGKSYLFKDLKCNSPTEYNITKSDDDDVINTEEHIKKNIDELNNDEIKARMKIFQEFKDSPDCFIYMPTGGRYFMPIPITTTRPPKIIRLRKDGVMTFKHNSYIKLSCTYEKFVRPIEGAHEIKVKCLNGSLVEYEDKAYEFDMFKCNTVPKPTLKKTTKKCQDRTDTRILVVGFQTSDAFLPLYKICYDVKARNPLYSWYHLKAPHLQPYDKLYLKPKLNFTNLFGNIHPPTQYELQKSTVETIIDSKALANWYIKNEGDTRRVLHPGLLTPQSAFSYPFEQYATYYYENSAPSWGMFNRGIWRDVETLIRLKMSHAKKRHMLVTGTHDVMVLHDVHRFTHPFYLALPTEMAVPQYIWLMDYNLDDNTGIVFIGRNNPYDALRAKSKFTICPAIPCPGNLIRRRDYSRDLLYCCTKHTFELAYGAIDHEAHKPYN